MPETTRVIASPVWPKAVALLGMAALLLPATGQEAAQEGTAAIARANALISFAYYTDWVAKPPRRSAGTLLIGILGKDAPRFVPDPKKLRRPFKSWSGIEF